MRSFKSIARRGGFTLIEILTVVVIIGILMGLLLKVIGPVRAKAKNMKMQAEISQMAQALERVRTELGGGDYPPDGSDVSTGYTDAVRWIRRAFPRSAYGYVTTDTSGLKIIGTAGTLYLGLRPDTALAFWLGGLRDASGNFIGFSADPTDPFNLNHAYNPTAPEARVGPYFDFDKTRVSQATYTSTASPTEQLNFTIGSLTYPSTSYQYFLGYAVYFPQNDQSITMPSATAATTAMTYSPYLYFKSLQGKYSDPKDTTIDPTTNAHDLYHYWKQPVDSALITAFKDAKSPPITNANAASPPVTRGWMNPQSFQILCPGLDGLFGQAGLNTTVGKYLASSTGETADGNSNYAPIYPDGTNYNTLRTADDVTNFSSGALSADMP